MNEMDFTGWARTAKGLRLVKTDAKYRRRLNYIRLVKSIKQRRGDLLYFIKCFLFNTNDF